MTMKMTSTPTITGTWLDAGTARTGPLTETKTYSLIYSLF